MDMTGVTAPKTGGRHLQGWQQLRQEAALARLQHLAILQAEVYQLPAAARKAVQGKVAVALQLLHHLLQLGRPQHLSAQPNPMRTSPLDDPSMSEHCCYLLRIDSSTSMHELSLAAYSRQSGALWPQHKLMLTLLVKLDIPCCAGAMSAACMCTGMRRHSRWPHLDACAGLHRVPGRWAPAMRNGSHLAQASIAVEVADQQRVLRNLAQVHKGVADPARPQLLHQHLGPA